MKTLWLILYYIDSIAWFILLFTKGLEVAVIPLALAAFARAEYLAIKLEELEKLRK